MPAFLAVKRKSNIYLPTPQGYREEDYIYAVVRKCKLGVTGLLLNNSLEGLCVSKIIYPSVTPYRALR